MVYKIAEINILHIILCNLVPKRQTLCTQGNLFERNIIFFQFSGHEPIYFIENKEKTLRASYDRDTQLVDYMD